MNDIIDETDQGEALKRWVKRHAGCRCSRFTDFSIAQGKEVVSRMHAIVCKALPGPASLPQVVWQDDSDVDGTASCHKKPGTDSIQLAKGSCVSWITTLVAFVHAMAHVLRDAIEKIRNKEGDGDGDGDENEEESDNWHCFKWRRAVGWITLRLVNLETGLDKGHNFCIREGLRVLRKVPNLAERVLSAPTFLMECQAVCSGMTLSLRSAIQDGIKQRRIDASQGTARWRFQEEFDAPEASMQRHGRVEQGSLVEFALQLRRDHDRHCICCSHNAFTPHEAKELIERLVDKVLPLHLPVSFEGVPTVKFTLSTKSIKGYVDDRGNFCINLNRLETYSDVLRVVIREWARRFVTAHYDVKQSVLSSGHYQRAVAGFSSLLVAFFPFDNLLLNWFPSRKCVCLALVPAPVWVGEMVPLNRLSQEGAIKVLREGTFDDLMPVDLNEYRQQALVLKEGAMHAELEGTCDFKDYLDFMAIRGHSTRASILPYRHGTKYEFRMSSRRLNVIRDLIVPGKTTALEMTDMVVHEVSRAAHIPDDPSLYEVRFNGELVDDSERVADLAEIGHEIRIEPIQRQVNVLSGWSSEVIQEIGVPSIITARELLEIVVEEDPASACIVQNGCCVLHPVDTVDTRAELRMFTAGYVQLCASLTIGRQLIRDMILVDASEVTKPLEDLLSRWRRTYGIKGEIECEGSVVNSITTVEELAHTHRFNPEDGPLQVEPMSAPTELDVPVHSVRIWLRNRKGKQQRHLKLKGHHTLEKGFTMLCKMTGMLPQAAQLTTLQGRPVDPRLRIFGLGLNEDCPELFLTRKIPPKPVSRKRINSSLSGKHESREKLRFGRFAHPRPDACIIISSDSEDDDTNNLDQ